MELAGGHQYPPGLAPNKGKGSDDAPSAEVKTTSDEGGDVYLLLQVHM